MLSVSNDYASFCKHGLSMVTSVVSEFRGGREKNMHAHPLGVYLRKKEQLSLIVADNTW